jgi:hypothetical protein
MLLMPLLVAAASIIFLRDVLVILILLGFPVTLAAAESIAFFFAFLSILPSWIGSLIWKEVNVGIDSFGQKQPTLFLKIVSRINLTVYLGYGIVVALYLLNQYPSVKADFNLASNSPTELATTVLTLYSWALVFEILFLVVFFPTKTNHLGMARLCVLSGLEDIRSPFVDDSIKYFNRFLRQAGWKFGIRSDTKLSMFFFARPTIRSITLGRLLNAINERGPSSLVRVVADLAGKEPDEVLERRYLVQSSSQLVQTIVAIAALILALITAWPTLHTL